MDNEMIERVIKASFDCWKEDKLDKSDYTLDDLSTDEYEFAVRHAKAIIKAMREPTDKMADAAKSRCFIEADPNSRATWIDMIDAVLND